MADSQKDDPEVQAYRTADSSLKLEDIPFGTKGTTLLCDTSAGQPRPIVPTAWRRRVFDLIHGLSHPSVRATRKLMAAKFVWHGLQKQVGTWAKACIHCQASKTQQHIRAPLETFQVPPRRFDHIHVDLVGPLPPSDGSTHLLTVIDRFTRWPEAIPLSNTTAATCAQALVTHWIARFGVPLDISSDRGPQFTSQLWTSIAQLLGTKLHHTTAYHPQSNGLIERFHRHLKSSLRARLVGPNWIRELPWVLLGIRTMPKEDLGCSVAELVYGAPLTVPGDFLANYDSSPDQNSQLQQLRDQVRSMVPIPTSHHGIRPTTLPANLQRAKFVFIRRDGHRTPLQRPYEGPFKVVETGPKTFKVEVKGKTETVTVDRLKLAFVNPNNPTQPTQPQPHKRSSNNLPKPDTPVMPQPPALPQRTRTGRLVRRPQRYISVLGGGGGGHVADRLREYTENLMWT